MRKSGVHVVGLGGVKGLPRCWNMLIPVTHGEEDCLDKYKHYLNMDESGKATKCYKGDVRAGIVVMDRPA